MKLDTKNLRYLTKEDWRVLTAVEAGSRNHEVVPTKLIIQLSNLRSGSGVHKSISTLAKANLIARTKNAKYDGYRLTYGGLDYLALHTHLKHDTLYSLGSCIGTGKESDIYLCAPPHAPSNNHKEYVLKIHRLGRTSFRTVKTNRDYLRHRQSASWMYMSRLSAQKEFAFMKALSENGFKVPEPIAWNRHTVIMSLIDGVPLRAVKDIQDPAALYGDLIAIIMRLASHGLIHGDFNEFNIMIEEKEANTPARPTPSSANTQVSSVHGSRVTDTVSDVDDERHVTVAPWVIDFPQAVSIDHPNAKFYFERDVQCIKTFFARRFHFESSEMGPYFEDVQLEQHEAGSLGATRLDVEVEASGFSRKMAKDLEKYREDIDLDSNPPDEELDKVSDDE